MKLYIASHSQATASELKHRLEACGHAVVARWITADLRFGLGVTAYTDDERRALALADEEDVRAADGLILLAEPEGRTVPGGKHVETGIALALGRPVFVVGRRENVFHWHPLVRVVPGVEDLLAVLHEHVRADHP